MTLSHLHAHLHNFTLMDMGALGQMASEVLQEQSPAKLVSCRTKFYDLLSNCIPADTILRTLASELQKRMESAELKHMVMEMAAYYEHRMQCGSKAIFHLEAFLAKFMSHYKNVAETTKR